MFQLMRRFLFLSLLFLFTSCNTYKLYGDIIESETKIDIPYFNKVGEEYLFNATINAYQNQLGGIFVVKCLGENHHRVALLSDFGNTILDVELNEDVKIVHYIIEDLNRKTIVNKLTDYLQFLLRSSYTSRKYVETDSAKTYEAQWQKSSVLIWNRSDKIDLLQQSSKTKKKVEIKYTFLAQGELETVILEAKELPIKMTFIKQ